MTTLLCSELSKNYSVLTVPAVFATTCLAPHLYAIVSSNRAYDNCQPRAFRDSIEKTDKLSKVAKSRLLRALGASANGFETVGFYAGAIAVSNLANVETCQLNLLSECYLVVRLAYVYVYIFAQENRKYHVLRTALYATSNFIAMTLWIKAGLKFIK